MYYYIYDSFVSDHKYQKAVQKIEHRLTDLGISGRKVQLSLLKSLKELVSDQYATGVKNFIAVGDDKTFLNLINAVAEFDVTVGYIPLGQEKDLADLFGIPQDEQACDILSARITQSVDLGKINHYYFLTNVKIQSQECILDCDEQYNVKVNSKDTSVEISNLNTHLMLPDIIGDINPCDGRLNIVVQSPSRPEKSLRNLFKKSRRTLSYFTIDTVKITRGKDLKAIVDGCRAVKMPIEISVAPNKLKLIVGKARKVLT